jgi:hypothetical protein
MPIENSWQLAAVVLVVDRVGVLLVVQPEDHRRVLRQLQQQRLEVAEGVLAKHL